MLKTDRLILLPAVFGLIILLAALGSWAVLTIAHRNADYPIYVARASGPNARIVRQRDQPCREETSIEQSGLCAQWRAARAEEDTASWALGQFIISVIGAFGLGATLWMNKRALEVATSSTAQQMRAWMSLEIRLGPGHLSWKGDHCFLQVRFNAENVGNTPALSAWTFASAVQGDDIDREVANLQKIAFESSRASDPGTVFPNRTMRRSKRLDVTPRDPHAPVTVIAIVQYRTVFDKPNSRPHQTVRVWDVIAAGRETRPPDHGEDAEARATFKLIPNETHPGDAN